MEFFRGPWTLQRILIVGAGVFGLTVIILFLTDKLGPEASLSVDKEGESGPTLEEVVQHGQERWTELRASGADIANGPCLDDGETYEGWAIDLVREGRIDYLPENQCPSYNSGRSTRLIELSLEGNIVRVEPEWLWNSGTTELP